MTLVRLIIFTILVPGTIAVYIPRWLVHQYPATIDIGVFRYSGIIFVLAGSVFYLLSVVSFLIEGGGTPAIWFTKPIKFLIGEEPHGLVRGTMYRFTRNPMYLGVMSFVLGHAIWFEVTALFLYTIVLFLCFHFVVVFIEEPHLRKKNGASYEEFCRTVPRWIGFQKKISHKSEHD
jgi:protein-S-isoprenylcysteine O-methyltransferase Ste14